MNHLGYSFSPETVMVEQNFLATCLLNILYLQTIYSPRILNVEQISFFLKNGYFSLD